MKKLTIALITVLMSVLLVLPAFAAQNATVTVTPNKSTANAGDTVTFTVKITGCTAAKSIGIIPKYDESTFELVSGEWLVSGSAMSDFSGGTASIAYASARAFNENVFKFQLKVKSSASLSAYTVNATVSIKNGNEAVNCTVNGAKVTVACKHTYSAFSSISATQHQRTCSKCKAVDKKNHAFSNACDTSCNDCGFTRTTTHNYKTTWSSDANQHWHECSVCKDKKDVAAHVPGDAATEQTAQKCTVCDRELSGVLEHVHSFGADWKSDENGHFHVCSSCRQSSTVEAHVYDNACDDTCNTCSYKRAVTHTFGQAFVSDGTNHWHICDICKASSETEAHKYDNSCDSECNDCKATREVTHKYGEGTVKTAPTESVAGEKEYACTLCGGKKTVELEYFKSGGDGVSDNASSGSSSVITYVIIAAVAFVAGAAICYVVMTVILKKKK